MVYETANAHATWQTCVVAEDTLKVLILNYQDIRSLVAKRPEVESDFRAGKLALEIFQTLAMQTSLPYKIKPLLSFLLSYLRGIWGGKRRVGVFFSVYMFASALSLRFSSPVSLARVIIIYKNAIHCVMKTRRQKGSCFLLNYVPCVCKSLLHIAGTSSCSDCLSEWQLWHNVRVSS